MRLRGFTLSFPVRVHFLDQRRVPDGDLSYKVAVLAFKAVYTRGEATRERQKGLSSLC
jgi:hypothetical protein